MIPDHLAIHIHPYTLRMKRPPNSRVMRREIRGVLLRSGGGFACLQPWPELGDPPLEKCLADLTGPRRWPIVRRALRCAEFDEAGRQFEHSLFEEMEVPESHATLAEACADQVSHAVEAGFSRVKLKCGKDLAAEAAFLTQMAALFPALFWRLDFNETPDPAAVIAFATGLDPATRGKIDFLEDPSPYSETAWREIKRATGLKLAVDRESAPGRTSAQVMVIKPTLDEPFLLAEAAIAANQRVIVTGNMDHPLGQAFAAWEAARLSLQFPGLVGTCGLQTHHLFEPDAFSEMLGDWQPAFTPPEGNGLGFTDLLENLPWRTLE